VSFLEIGAELRELDDESSARHQSRVCTLLPRRRHMAASGRSDGASGGTRCSDVGAHHRRWLEAIV
jgi:hypothetical protein